MRAEAPAEYEAGPMHMNNRQTDVYMIDERAKRASDS